MKIAVYTIAKNEEQYAKRWAESAKDADYRVVLDTGSIDTTPQLLTEAGVEVHGALIKPWRFDFARNAALALVPQDADVCISLDMDEVLRPGWREAIEREWTPTTTLLRHKLYPEWDQVQNKPTTYFAYAGRVHARHAYQWHFAVHEVLAPLGEHVETFSEDFVIDHITDHTRDKKIYSDMLSELVVHEPDEPRYSFYYAGDLFNKGLYAECITEYKRFLSLAKPTAHNERGFACRVIGRAYRQLGLDAEVYMPYFYRATVESPHEREVWYEFADICAQLGNLPNAFSGVVNALRVTNPRNSFHVDIAAWDGTAEALLDEVATKLGISKEYVENFKKTL